MGLFDWQRVITQYTEQQSGLDVFGKAGTARVIKNRISINTQRISIGNRAEGSLRGVWHESCISRRRAPCYGDHPGPGSGKPATCLHSLIMSTKAAQSRVQSLGTFPIWNLPLKHPVNMAYEAATSDLNDVNMIDPFHLEAYGKTAVNYNRDIDAFPIAKTISRK